MVLMSANAQLFWGEVKRDWRRMLEKWAEVETPPTPPPPAPKPPPVPKPKPVPKPVVGDAFNIFDRTPPPPVPHNAHFDYECAMMHAWIDNLDERLDAIARPYRKR